MNPIAGTLRCPHCKKDVYPEIQTYTPGLDKYDEYRSRFDVRVSIHCRICNGFISEGTVAVYVMREDGLLVSSSV